MQEYVYFAVLGLLITGLIVLLLCVKRTLDRESAGLSAVTEKLFTVQYTAWIREAPKKTKVRASKHVSADSKEDAVFAAQAWLTANGYEAEDFQASEAT